MSDFTAGTIEQGARAARPGRERIDRPGLAQRISSAIDGGAVMLVAPAGYGKTMALEEALATSGRQAARIFCSEDEREPGRLLLGIVDALKEPIPGIAEDFGRRLGAATERIDPLAGLRALLSELAGVLVDPIAVVIEDAEQLAPAPEAARLLEELLNRRPESVSVAIASRTALPIREARLRASGRLAVIGPESLVFSAEECARLIGGAAPGDAGDAGDERVERAMAATEGWPLGLALFDAAGAETLSAPESRQTLFDYLAEEVVDRLDPELRDVVLESSLPEELGPSLADAIGLGGESLDAARRRLGPFLRPAGDAGEALRYHPLLRAFLRERLQRERSEEQMRELHARIAAALAETGRPRASVDHWLDAERWDEAVEAIAAAGFELLASSPQAVGRWIARLPVEARGAPAIVVLEAQLEYGAGAHESAARLQRRVLTTFRETGQRELDWTARIALMNTLHASGGFEEAIELAEGVDAPETADIAAAPNVAVMAAMCLSHLGRLDEVEAMLARAVAHPVAGPSLPLARACEGLFLDRPAGRLTDAVRKCREALAELDRDDPFDRGPFVRALMHLVLEEQGRDDEALRESLRAQEDAMRIGIEGYLVAMLRMHSVGIHARAGRLAEAERELERGAPFERGSGWRQVTTGRAILAAERGNRDEALRRAEETLEKVATGPYLQRVHAIEFLAPVLVRCERPDLARRAVEDALADWRQGYYRGRLLAQRAWLRELDGGEWEEDLRRAWEETGSEAEHLVRREWPRLRPLLWTALERGTLSAEEVIAAVQAAFPGEEQLVEFADHPAPAVRRAAIGPSVASGNPRVLGELDRLVADPDAGVAAAARAAAERLRREPPSLAFRLLGGFEVRRGSWTVDASAWTRPMAARLVRLLLTRRPEAVPEDEIFEALWPGKDAAAARRNLQVAVSQARAVLDPAGGEHSYIVAKDRAYRLELRATDSVDSEEFERATAVTLAEGGAARRRLLERAVELWSGEPLPEDRYEDWSARWRERLVDRYGEVITALVAVCRDQRDLPAELRAARELVALDPLDEAAQRELITSYARAGRREQALRQYLDCRHALVESLGVEPAEETQALHRRVLAGERL